MIQQQQTAQKIKILLTGYHNTGKTTLLNNYTSSYYGRQTQPTIGINFGRKTLHYNDDSFHIRIFDMQGDLQHLSILKSYLRISEGTIFMYNVFNRQSFQFIEKTIELAEQEQNNQQGIEHVKYLLGTHQATNEEERQVDEEEGRELAGLHQMQFFQVNLMSQEDVQTTFQSMIVTIVETNRQISRKTQKLLLSGQNKTMVYRPGTRYHTCC